MIAEMGLTDGFVWTCCRLLCRNYMYFYACWCTCERRNMLCAFV